MAARKRCPQEEVTFVSLSISGSGFAAEAALGDEVRLTFREPLAAELLGGGTRRGRLGERALPPQGFLSHLDDAAALVYEDAFAPSGCRWKPSDPSARRGYRAFEAACVAAAASPRAARALFRWRLAGPGVVVSSVEYPLANPAWFVFEAAAPVTLGLAAYVHAIAYHLTYALEAGGASAPAPRGGTLVAQEVPVLPRGVFEIEPYPPFEDLIATGASRLSVHAGPVVFADFYCGF